MAQPLKVPVYGAGSPFYHRRTDSLSKEKKKVRLCSLIRSTSSSLVPLCESPRRLSSDLSCGAGLDAHSGTP